MDHTTTLFYRMGKMTLEGVIVTLFSLFFFDLKEAQYPDLRHHFFYNPYTDVCKHWILNTFPESCEKKVTRPLQF